MGAIQCVTCAERRDAVVDPEQPFKRPLLLKLRNRSSSFRVGSQEYETVFPPLFFKPSLRFWMMCFMLGIIVALCFTVWKDWLDQHGLPAETLLEYASIPMVSVLFTYYHIWAALYLTFFPVLYKGCLQIQGTNAGCGWQGIMPNKATKMARMSVRLMTEKLISVKDIVARIDANRIVQELEPALQTSIVEIVSEVAVESEPGLWQNVPTKVQQRMIANAKADAPTVISGFVADLKNNIESVLDLEQLVVDAFVREPALLNHMFISCGFAELAFIRDCGAYMGGVFGIIQVIIWIVYPRGWMLPTFGFVAGLWTNWIALKMIFEPVEPVKICGLTLQGLFLRRQKEVAEVYAQIVADNILYARNILREIIRGRLANEMINLLVKHIDASTDRIYPSSVRLFKSSKAVDLCKRKAAEKIIERLPESTSHVEQYLDTTMALEVLLYEKLSNIPSTDFEQLLHPVFQEDEWKLILMGGVLGIVIGCLQWKFLGS